MNSNQVPDDVWINLKILSGLPPHKRLNTASKLYYQEEDSVWTTIRRSLTSACREQTVGTIDELIMRCKRAFDEHGEIPKLAKHIEAAKAGVKNLRKTYSGDPTTQASIDRLLDKMDECVAKIE